jgi:hypothetical protein
MSEQTELRQAISALRYNLYATAEGATRTARLVWGVYGEMPQITVYTGVENDRNKGVMSVSMPYESICVMLDTLNDLYNDPEPQKTRLMEIFQNRKDPATGAYGKVRTGALAFGVDENGEAWIRLVEKDRPKIIFRFNVSPNVQFFRHDKTPIARGETSRAYLKSATEYLKTFYDNALPRNRGDRKPAFINTPVPTPAPSTSPAPSFDDDDVSF